MNTTAIKIIECKVDPINLLVAGVKPLTEWYDFLLLLINI